MYIEMVACIIYLSKLVLILINLNFNIIFLTKNLNLILHNHNICIQQFIYLFSIADTAILKESIFVGLLTAFERNKRNTADTYKTQVLTKLCKSKKEIVPLQPRVPGGVHAAEVVVAVGGGDERGHLAVGPVELRQGVQPVHDHRDSLVHHVDDGLVVHLQRLVFGGGARCGHSGFIL